MKSIEKAVRLLLGLGLVVCCYYLGLFASRLIDGFISPAVSGMLILFVLLKSGLLRKDWVEEGAGLLNRHMILFFVPITVGIVLIPASVWAEDGLAMLVALVLSTFIVLWFTGKIVQRYGR
jgi:Putative effector of murein hydrolase LrgA